MSHGLDITYIQSSDRRLNAFIAHIAAVYLLTTLRKKISKLTIQVR